MRRHASFQYGSLKIHTVTTQIFSFLRKAFGADVFLVCINTSDSDVTVNLLTSNEVAPRAYVALYIPGSSTVHTIKTSTLKDDEAAATAEALDTKYKPKSPVLTKNVALKAHDCLILTWPTSDWDIFLIVLCFFLYFNYKHIINFIYFC